MTEFSNSIDSIVTNLGKNADVVESQKMKVCPGTGGTAPAALRDQFSGSSLDYARMQ